jgi:hypothetical protein
MDGIRRVMTVGRRFQPNRLSDQALSQAYQPLVPVVRQRVSQTLQSSGLSLQAHICKDQRMPRRAAGGHR